MRVRRLAVPLLGAFLVAGSGNASGSPLIVEQTYNPGDLLFGRGAQQSISFTQAVPVSVVPEPTSLVLLGTGVVAAALRKRSAKRRRPS